jgi:hypothetical protein
LDKKLEHCRNTKRRKLICLLGHVSLRCRTAKQATRSRKYRAVRTVSQSLGLQNFNYLPSHISYLYEVILKSMLTYI